LSFESLKTGLIIAADHGFTSEILTSGIWYRTDPCLLDEIAGIDNVSIRVSVDSEHQESVPVDQIVALLTRADQLGIEANLTIRDIPENPGVLHHTLTTIEEALPEFYSKNRDRSRFCHRIPHMPVYDPEGQTPGAAAVRPGSGKWRKSCGLGSRDLVVGEDGIVYPCCGVIGLDCRSVFSIGDPLKKTWQELLSMRDRHPLLRVLREEGPYQMAISHGLTPEQWRTRFETACHLCLTLFTFFPEQIVTPYCLEGDMGTVNRMRIP